MALIEEKIFGDPYSAIFIDVTSSIPFYKQKWFTDLEHPVLRQSKKTTFMKNVPRQRNSPGLWFMSVLNMHSQNKLRGLVQIHEFVYLREQTPLMLAVGDGGVQCEYGKEMMFARTLSQTLLR